MKKYANCLVLSILLLTISGCGGEQGSNPTVTSQAAVTQATSTLLQPTATTLPPTATASPERSSTSPTDDHSSTYTPVEQPTVAPTVTSVPISSVPVGEGRLVVADGNLEGGGVFTIKPDGSDKRVLVNGGRIEEVRWSPDRKQIVYLESGGLTSTIGLINADGSSKRTLVNSELRIHGLRWSPDGSQIAYTDGGGGTDPDPNATPTPEDQLVVKVVSLTGGAAKVLAQGHEPSWRADGKVIAFIVRKGAEFELHTINADGTGEQRVLGMTDLTAARLGLKADELPTDSAFEYLGTPAYNPVDNRIVFFAAGLPTFLIVMDEAGKSLRITAGSNEGVVDSPAWSPDGKLLAYTSGNGNGGRGVTVTDPSTNDPEPLWSAGMDPSIGQVSGVWSPDGSHLVINQFKPDEGLLIRDLEGTEQPILQQTFLSDVDW